VPDLLPGYLTPLPDDRPVGLRRRSLGAGTELWRIDATHPAKWTWEGFPTPRYRFDPESGAFRTRYAGTTFVGAFRERYRMLERVIPDDHANHYLIRLLAVRRLRILDLRTEANLDALDVDDQISTSQAHEIWDTCHRLADAVRKWWKNLDAIVYGSRTAPESSTNIAFFATDAFAIEAWKVAQRVDILTELVLRHRFTVRWLE
jgi:RES domain